MVKEITIYWWKPFSREQKLVIQERWKIIITVMSLCRWKKTISSQHIKIDRATRIDNLPSVCCCHCYYGYLWPIPGVDTPIIWVHLEWYTLCIKGYNHRHEITNLPPNCQYLKANHKKRKNTQRFTGSHPSNLNKQNTFLIWWQTHQRSYSLRGRCKDNNLERLVSGPNAISPPGPWYEDYGKENNL